MQVLQTPADFQRSYLSAHRYPENLSSSSTYTYATNLQLYKRLLDIAEHDLFLDDASSAEMQVSFRDLHTASGKGASPATSTIVLLTDPNRGGKG